MKKVVKFLTQHINAVAIGQLVVDIDMVPQFRKTRIDMSFLYASSEISFLVHLYLWPSGSLLEQTIMV